MVIIVIIVKIQMQTSNDIYIDPILKYYNNCNNFNATQILRSYNNTNNINIGPIVRSYNYISNTGDDPFLHIFPYSNELYDNFVTNLTNLYNLETYYLHNK